MRRLTLAAALLLAGCVPTPVATATATAAYEPDAPSAPRRTASRPPPRPAAAAIDPAPAADTSPAAVLRDSAAAHNEAFRYAAWSKARTANVLALVPLTAELSRAIRAMQQSRTHGHYGPAQTKALRAATDALDDFLQHKQD